MDTSDIFTKMNQDMNKSIDHVLSEFSSLHTGKANSSMVESITVDVYGSAMKLRDVAAITTPDARTIQIQPWDKSTCAPIEKALLEAKLGITPLITGEIIRLPIPELSGERREELCKMAQGFAEQSRIGVRASRKEAMDALKEAQKNGLPEDDFKKGEKDVQKNTDDAVAKINDALLAKESDLRKV
jgi:ribosome recycling factor